MRLSPHFTVAEFTVSSTARDRGIDNALPATLLAAAGNTCDMLERIRAHLTRVAGHAVPITLSSGYRCLPLNRALGSSDTSDHIRAAAADFTAPAFGTPFAIAAELAQHVSALGIGQLIHEFGRWVHVSTVRPGKDVNRVITISARGTEVGIQPIESL